MKASELIADLRTLIQERGDLEVVNAEDESVMIVFNDTDGDAVFVIE